MVMAANNCQTVVFDVPEDFHVEAVVGQGAYGAVCKATWDAEDVAIKKIPGYDKSSETAKKVIREVEILQQFQYCPQVIACHSIFRPPSGDKDIYLVMDYVPCDLSTAMKAGTNINESVCRYIVCQLLLAMHAMHYYGCIHRDLSCRNILLDGEGRVSVCDFGLSRFFDPEEQLSFGVVTQWYRAPEIITDAKYETKSDIFSVGVILGELLLQKHLFPGRPNDPADQLSRVFTVLGTPDLKLFTDPGQPYYSSSDNAKRYVQMYVAKRPLPNRLRKIKFGLDHQPEAVDTLAALLLFNPVERPSARQALQMPWFNQLRDFINEELDAQDKFHAANKFVPTPIPGTAKTQDIVAILQKMVPVFNRSITQKWKEELKAREE